MVCWSISVIWDTWWRKYSWAEYGLATMWAIHRAQWCSAMTRWTMVSADWRSSCSPLCFQEKSTNCNWSALDRISASQWIEATRATSIIVVNVPIWTLMTSMRCTLVDYPMNWLRERFSYGTSEKRPPSKVNIQLRRRHISTDADRSRQVVSTVSMSTMIRSISSMWIIDIRFNLVVLIKNRINLRACRKRVNTVNVNSKVSTINVNVMTALLDQDAINVSLRVLCAHRDGDRKINNPNFSDHGCGSLATDGFVRFECRNCLLHRSIDQMHQ